MGVIVSPLVAPVLITLFYPVYWRLKITTSYDYIAKRFGRNARFCASGLFVFARLGWLGTVVYAPAMALHIATGIPLYWAIALMGAGATAYTLLGGLSAVLWTDVLQFVVLAGGAVWIAISLSGELGWNGIIDGSLAAGKFDIFDWKINPLKMTATAAMISYFFIFMQDYGTDQISVQRLISVKSFSGLARAIVFNSCMDVIVNAVLLFIGLGLFVKYQGSVLDEKLAGVAILPHYIVTSLPNGISGLVITGIFAAAMSSMDSGLNSVSTVVINDFIEPVCPGMLSESQKIRSGRYITLGLGVCATVMAFYASRIGHIVEVWSDFMGLFAAPVLAMFLLGLLVRKAVFTDWLAGAAASLILVLLLQSFTLTHWIYLFPISLTTTLLVSIVSMLIMPRRRAA
jgi:SSS family transporter